MQDLIPFLLSNYLVQIPPFLVWLVGFVIALARWGRHPRASLLTSVAMLTFMARALVVPLLRFWIQNADVELGQIGARFAVLNVASALVAAVAWILVLMAVFGERSAGETSGT